MFVRVYNKIGVLIFMLVENNLFKVNSNFSSVYTGISKKVIICHLFGHLVTYYKYWRLEKSEKEALDTEVAKLTRTFQTFLSSNSHIQFVKREIRAVLIRSLENPKTKEINELTIDIFVNKNFKEAYASEWKLSCLHPLKTGCETGNYPIFILKPGSKTYQALEQKFKDNKISEGNLTEWEKRFKEMQTFSIASQRYLNKLEEIRTRGVEEEKRTYKLDLYFFDLFDNDPLFQDKINEFNKQLMNIETPENILNFMTSVYNTVENILDQRQKRLNEGKGKSQTKALGQDHYLPGIMFILACLKNPIIQEMSTQIGYFDKNHPNRFLLKDLSAKLVFLTNSVQLLLELRGCL